MFVSKISFFYSYTFQVYGVDKDALEEHVMALVSLLPLCNDTEKLALLNLFALIANNKPAVSEKRKFLFYYSV